MCSSDLIWDESYDIEENHTLRFMKILDLITELTNKDQSEKLMIAKKCKPIIEYNINHLRNLHNNVYIQRLVNDYGIA